MFISVEQYIAEEREFILSNGSCPSKTVILQLIRRDVRVAFFYLPKKVTQLVCMDTQSKIPKAYWSPEITAAAAGMKANLKVPTWGFWSLGIITVLMFITVPIGFYLSVKDTVQPTRPFISENALQQKMILQGLSTGDLVSTTNKVYMISGIDAKYVTLIESENVPTGDLAPLSNDDYPENSFSGEVVKVLKPIFESSRVDSRTLIIDVLDN
ncbi:hypothetical protein [Fulvivirga ligni]|uniref:hypothetical protein n=1 Tax=Fulvivirga ligni TaxID=2904246 RepID=UPI001F392C8C|nr:hypothetical protein [Fulvivirga ligni]UII20712.1 hypothetical protein LVD16_22995 [Fulvivirga ligni]